GRIRTWRFLGVSWSCVMRPTDYRHGRVLPDPGCGISAAARRVVLWIGTNWPDILSGECSSRNLTLLPIALDDLQRAAPHSRVLVLEVPNDDATFISWGSRTIADALDHGLRVALVQSEENQRLPLIDQGSLDQFFSSVKSLSCDPERSLAMYRKWDR